MTPTDPRTNDDPMEPRSQRILVVYDSRAIRDTISLLAFEDGSYEVMSLDEPARAVEVVASFHPDLIVLCAMTPHSSVLLTCRSLKQTLGGEYVPLVVFSLRSDMELRQSVFDAGADDMIQVTIAPEEMLLRIRSLIRIRTAYLESVRRGKSLARASAEAADMILQLEEADRRIREQNKALIERDARIQEQQAEIESHLQTLRRELDLAASLQVSLLPSGTRFADVLTIADTYIPAADLGGDYYDFMTLPDGRVFIAIADVTGHGVAPALVSVQMRTLARSTLHSGATLPDAVGILNRYMCETFHHDFFMTMAALLYDPHTHELEFVGAGHCPILHMKAEAKETIECFSRGLPLGISHSAAYEMDSIPLAPEDLVLLYTDGITEATNEAGEEFGAHRLVSVAGLRHDLPPRQILDRLLNAARAFSSHDMFDDDVTLVAFRPAVDGASSSASDGGTDA